MTSARIAPPDADEYAPFYAGYVALSRAHDPVALLERQLPALRSACNGMTDAAARFRYAPGKWSIKQVMGHLSDTERVFAYRLFRISRGDATPLSGFDQDAYVDAAGSDERPLSDLLAELESARAATLRLVAGIAPKAWTRRGTANGLTVSARALAYIVTGHVEHHLGLLRERYGVAVPHTGAASA